jgi:hypothetical protein
MRNKLLVVPATADNTIICLDEKSINDTRFFILSGLPKEVPPNFITFIYYYNLRQK